MGMEQITRFSVDKSKCIKCGKCINTCSCMGRKSVLHIHAGKTVEDWIIEVGGRCHIIASGEWG